MSGYIKKQLSKYNNPTPKLPQHAPYPCAPKTYGKLAQDPIATENSPPAGTEGITHAPKVIGSILYYVRSVDSTHLVALNTLASEHAHMTEKTIENMKHMLDYLATNPNETVRFYQSDMILNEHSNSSYLSAKNAKSRAAGHLFLGWQPDDKQPIRLNGPILTLCTILKFVAASAAEAELGAMFLNAKEAKIIRLTLEELGHPQPPTPMHCDNATAAGIANNTVKRQRS